MKSTGLLVMLLLLTNAVHSFVPFRSIYLGIPLLVLHKHFLASNADLEEYNNCGNGKKFCFGDIEGCVERRDCTLFSLLDFTYSRIDITVSRRCAKTGIFFAAILLTFDVEKNPDGYCSTSLSPKNYSVYQLWEGQRCKFDKEREPLRRSKTIDGQGSLNDYCRSRNPEVLPYSISISVGTKLPDIPHISSTYTTEIASFFENLPNNYTHNIIREGKGVFYITEVGKYTPHSHNAAAEILASWLTLVVVISSVHSQF